MRETRLEAVVGADGVPRSSVETGHHRGLHTVFGEVEVTRFADRRRGCDNLYAADAMPNLPEERHSHGLRRRTYRVQGGASGGVGWTTVPTGALQLPLRRLPASFHASRAPVHVPAEGPHPYQFILYAFRCTPSGFADPPSFKTGAAADPSVR